MSKEIGIRCKLCLLAFLIAAVGCEVVDDVISDKSSDNSSVSASVASTNDTTTSTASETNGATSGDFDYDSVQWGGESFAEATIVDMSLNSASISGDTIRFDYEMNDSWPDENGAQAIACAFKQQEDGSWYGGKFDWIRSGGQSTKSTENIVGGYGAWSGNQPSSGQLMAFVWVSVDGEHRSTSAYAYWP